MDDIKIIEPYNPTVATSRQPGAKTGTPSPTELNGFPFPSSTPLYPEWSVAALPHVPAAVQKASHPPGAATPLAAAAG